MNPKQSHQTHPWTRRIAALATPVLLLAALTAAGCGSNSSTGTGSGTGSAAATGASTTAPASAKADPTPTDKTVTIGLPSAILTGLDPGKGGVTRLDLSVQSTLYSSLTTINDKLDLVGDLATSWKQLAPNQWEFTLRKGAKYQNGDPLDASVVAWNAKRVLGDPSKYYEGALLGDITSVKAKDPETVVVTTKAPSLDLPRRVSFFYFLDPKWVAEGHNPDREANASGPYQLVSIDNESKVVLKRNPTYYGTPPAYGNAVYSIVPSESGRIAALQSGDVDITTVIDPQDLPQLKSVSSLVSGAVQSNSTAELRINSKIPPFNNQNVRLAVNYALDKESIIKAVLGGLTVPSAGQVLMPLYQNFNKSLQAYPYDPGKAKELLAAAGVPKDLSFTLNVPTGAYVGVDLISQIIAKELGEVGFKVKLNPQQFSAWVDASLKKPGPQAEYIADGSVDTSSALLSYYKADFIQSIADDPVYDRYVDQLNSATTAEEQQQWADKATAEARSFGLLAFLYPQPLTYSHSKNVAWNPRPDQWIRAQDLAPAA